MLHAYRRPHLAASRDARPPAQGVRAARPQRQRCLHAQASAAVQPVKEQVSAFAPATVANLGPGFDWMGCAVEVRANRPMQATVPRMHAMHSNVRPRFLRAAATPSQPRSFQASRAWWRSQPSLATMDA